MAEIEKLIERLEKLTGPDRDVDEAIGVRCSGDWSASLCPKHYTRLLDATIPGEDIVIASEQRPHPDRPNETKWMALQRHSRVAAYGNTEAIARRIAALKARAALEKDSGNDK